MTCTERREGCIGSDTYVIEAGDGVDTIYDDFTTPGANVVRFGAGVDPAQVKLRRGSLLLDLGEGKKVHIRGFDTTDVFNSVSIRRFEFADGTVLTARELLGREAANDGRYATHMRRNAA